MLILYISICLMVAFIVGLFYTELGLTESDWGVILFLILLSPILIPAFLAVASMLSPIALVIWTGVQIKKHLEVQSNV